MISDYGLSASRHHVVRVRASRDTVPWGEPHSDGNEELLGRLFCVTARDDALAPTGILGAARDLRSNRSVDGTLPMYSRSSNAGRGASLYDPSVSHRQHESWQLKVFVSDGFPTVPKPALGSWTIDVTCKVTTSAELLKCKLSPRGSQSAEQALPLRQTPIKSAISAETFLTFTESIPIWLRILRFVVTGRLLIHSPRKTPRLFDRG